MRRDVKMNQSNLAMEHKNNKMAFVFIAIIKALSTMLITNSHLGSIYPISFIAKGGALGNTLFFIISGFLLYKPKENFVPWYKKSWLDYMHLEFSYPLYTLFFLNNIR